MDVLELKNINKSYKSGSDTISVLKDLTLSLTKGEICSIVGQSGCGKSTLLQIAGILDNPDSGSILINGLDFTSTSDFQRTTARRSMVGFVYQFHHLLPEFTALENLIIPQLIIGKREDSAVKYGLAMLSALGLESKKNNIPAQLSGGEQQRVAIGRAIINQPKLLLADELTGNLDPENASMIIELLIKMSKSLNLTVMLVTHNMDLAKRTDRIMELKAGKLVKVAK